MDPRAHENGKEIPMPHQIHESDKEREKKSSVAWHRGVQGSEEDGFESMRSIDPSECRGWHSVGITVQKKWGCARSITDGYGCESVADHVPEIYSPPSAPRFATDCEFVASWGLDLTTVDDEWGAWVSGKQRMRETTFNRDQPTLVIGSSVCTNVPIIMDSDWGNLGSEEKAERLVDDGQHLGFLFEVHRGQRKQGGISSRSIHCQRHRRMRMASPHWQGWMEHQRPEHTCVDVACRDLRMKVASLCESKLVSVPPPMCSRRVQ